MRMLFTAVVNGEKRPAIQIEKVKFQTTLMATDKKNSLRYSGSRDIHISPKIPKVLETHSDLLSSFPFSGIGIKSP